MQQRVPFHLRSNIYLAIYAAWGATFAFVGPTWTSYALVALVTVSAVMYPISMVTRLERDQPDLADYVGHFRGNARRFGALGLILLATAIAVAVARPENVLSLIVLAAVVLGLAGLHLSHYRRRVQ